MRALLTFVALCCAFALVLAITGCTQTPDPVYISTPLPPIPAECKGPWPAEPKLPEEPAQDIDDLGATKDRGKLKTALRTERHYRRVCLERLLTVLPGE